MSSYLKIARLKKEFSTTKVALTNFTEKLAVAALKCFCHLLQIYLKFEKELF